MIAARMLSPYTKILLKVSTLLALVGIGGTGCADPEIPALSSFRFLGQAEDSPLVLLLSVDFADADADIGTGTLELFLDDSAQAARTLDMTPLFLSSGLDADTATAGKLRFAVELGIDANDPPTQAQELALSAQAVDAAGQVSNRVTVHLRVSP